MKLQYQAVNSSGAAVTGTIDAGGPPEATDKLYAEGLYVTSIAPAEDAAAGPKESRFGGGRLKLVAGITRQLAVLTSTGTSVVQALAAVERQLEAGACKAMLADVLRRVEEGNSLAAAMSAHPRYFDAVYRSLVAAGETGGQLAKMLDRVGTMTRKRLKVRNTVTGALAYPVMLTIMSVVVVIVMLLAVLPRFAGLFKSLDAPMPPTTQMLMAVSGSLQAWWWAYGLAVVAAAAGLTAALRSAAGRRFLDAASLRLPVVGPFTRSLITARVVRTLGVLLEAKVPLLEALALVQEAAGSRVYAALVAKAVDAVTRGDTISSVLRNTPLINPSVYEAVLTGERSGQVGPILLNLSDFLDEDNEVVIKSMMSLIEPLILVVLGVVVGFVALSLFIPLFDLTSAADGGGHR